MADRNWLLDCDVNILRDVVRTWPNSHIQEALRKFRATWNFYDGKLSDGETNMLVRKESIIRMEFRRRMKKYIPKGNVNQVQESLIGHNPNEESLKIRR